MSCSRSLIALVVATGAAQASIVTTTGAALQISPPASSAPGALVGPTVKCWNEKQGVVVAGVAADIINNPSTTPGTGFGGVYSGTVDSHFLHFDFQPAPVIGSVLFNSNIVAVLFNDIPIDLTDAALGATSTLYPTTSPMRGWNGNGFITINGPLLTFAFVPTPVLSIEQVRVLTDHVPAPGSVALLGLGGVVASRRRRA